MDTDLDLRRRRAAWRASHRGTKEMDWLLGRFAAARLDGMDATALGELEALLTAPDPELQRWIMDGATVPEDRYAALILELRAFHELTAQVSE
jgi:antitoxin CptB